MKKKYLIPLTVVLVLLSSFVMGWSIYQYILDENRMEYVDSQMIGERMADFVLEDQEGRDVAVEASSGKPKLIHFWASWCPYCKEEAADLNRVYETYKDQIEFRSVNITTNDSEADALEYIDLYDVQMPVLFDKDGTVTAQYRVTVVPTSVLIKSDGSIHTVTYALTEKDITPHLEELVADGLED